MDICYHIEQLLTQGFAYVALPHVCRQQQEEAEAVEQAEADAAAREQLIERAELQAAEAADAAAAAARAAANKAKLEVFKAEAAAGEGSGD